MTWADLFERAAGCAVTEREVCERLGDYRARLAGEDPGGDADEP